MVCRASTASAVEPGPFDRYADDMVMVFAEERDAGRVLDVLPKRLGRYGLTFHPEKTRLVDFRRPGGCARKRVVSENSNEAIMPPSGGSS